MSNLTIVGASDQTISFNWSPDMIRNNGPEFVAAAESDQPEAHAARLGPARSEAQPCRDLPAGAGTSELAQDTALG